MRGPEFDLHKLVARTVQFARSLVDADAPIGRNRLIAQPGAPFSLNNPVVG
jgi:hypothetical protein